MLLFDAPSVFLDGQYVGDMDISLRPRTAQVSMCVIPDFNLYTSMSAVRGEILQIVLCEDGIVVFSILPPSLHGKKTN